MLRTLRIQNFKAWKDTGEIRLAPLTVFFGTNSAGKSSIPQLLLMLKQTVESDDVHNPLQLGDPSKAVELAENQIISFAKRYVAGVFPIFRMNWVVLADFENGILKKIWALCTTEDGIDPYNAFDSLTGILSSKFGPTTSIEETYTPPYTKQNRMAAYLAKSAVVRYRWDSSTLSRNIKIGMLNGKYYIGVEYANKDFITRVIAESKNQEKNAF